ncbi:12S seed storage globulin 2 [Rhynchospora pubera]|uniref:12S seed storage globulin 2 n=1 Tax=Rhynchospora pubera TaxID=906938 RepID=A0AAV8EW63_9POAL|nr:12S seed storage globulin 2 [Rhynchospora pubera]
MAVFKLSFLVSFLVLSYVAQAQLGQLGASRRKFGSQNRCRIDRLNALRPSRRTESEAGVTEYYDESEDQLECAGVSVLRARIEPNGLYLPSYLNSPSLVYVLRGRAVLGAVIPGCPETFQDLQQESEESYRGERGRREEYGGQQFRDEHQRIHHVRQGDVIAVPAGVPRWCYNDGETPVEVIVVIDVKNNANQLDPTLRHFMLAGRQQESSGRYRRGEGEQVGTSGNNILSGFDADLLAEAIGVNQETVKKLQSRNDERGEIVRVERQLRILRPSRTEEREESGERGYRRESEEKGERWEDKVVTSGNGFDEAICSMKMKENIADPLKADVYKPNGGRITFLNSQKLPILKYIQMSANRGVLHRNAILAPHWNMNAHAIVYVTSGRARMQVVSNEGQRAFDGELHSGQLIVVPQNFAVVVQSRTEGFSWISFQTNDNAMNTPIVGKTSALRGMPVDVLVNAYRGLSREEARRVKFNRGQEMTIFPSEGSRREYE